MVAAAVELIGERGYESTSLEAVASRAGMSRGAIYGNFANREDLFLEVAQQQWRPIAPDLRPGAPLKEQMRILGAAVAAEAVFRRKRAVGAISFQLAALKNADLRDRLREANRATYAWAAEQLTAAVPEHQLPLPADEFVKVVHALIEGLLLTHFLTPELITERTILHAFEALGSDTRMPEPDEEQS